MDSSLSGYSTALAALAATAAAKVFHVPSSAGGRSALSFDGKRILVPAIEAEQGEEVPVIGPGGKDLSSKVVGFDPSRGLAVLELGESLPATAWTPASAMPALGSLVLSVAYPSGDGPEARLDLVRIAHGAPSEDDAYVQVDGSSFPGFSGGAIVGTDGSLVGVIAIDRTGNRGWALPALRAKALVDDIVAKGFPSRAWLGISTMPVDIPASLGKAAGSAASGLLVAALEASGPAAAAGVLPGDILLSVGGTAVGSPGALREAIGKLAVGAAATLAVLRGGSHMEIAVKPVQRPEEGEAEAGHRGGWHRHWPSAHHGHHGHGHGGEGCGCGGEDCDCSADR